MPNRKPPISGILNTSLCILLIFHKTKVTPQNSPVLVRVLCKPWVLRMGQRDLPSPTLLLALIPTGCLSKLPDPPREAVLCLRQKINMRGGLAPVPGSYCHPQHPRGPVYSAYLAWGVWGSSYQTSYPQSSPGLGTRSPSDYTGAPEVR